MAAGGAAFGVFTSETFVEAIVIALILGGLFALGPKPFVVTGLLLPAAAGLVIGKLIVGAWREFRD